MTHLARWLGALVLAVVELAPVTASGSWEDPGEVITKRWTWTQVDSLELRGQVHFRIIPGPNAVVTVTANRALMDQLSVWNWWGWAGVIIETGLRGPREEGNVEITLELPQLRSLKVSGQSFGSIEWPAEPAKAKLEVSEASQVDILTTGGNYQIEALWKSVITWNGRANEAEAILKLDSTLDAREVTVTRGTATLRLGGKLQSEPDQQWQVRIIDD